MEIIPKKTLEQYLSHSKDSINLYKKLILGEVQRSFIVNHNQFGREGSYFIGLTERVNHLLNIYHMPRTVPNAIIYISSFNWHNFLMRYY